MDKIIKDITKKTVDNKIFWSRRDCGSLDTQLEGHDYTNSQVTVEYRIKHNNISSPIEHFEMKIELEDDKYGWSNTTEVISKDNANFESMTKLYEECLIQKDRIPELVLDVVKSLIVA